MAMGSTVRHSAGVVYRYKVEDAWGSLADALGDADHLLEREDCGPEKEWQIINVTTGETTGGGWGSFDGIDEVCACGKHLISRPDPHEEP